MMNNQSEPTVVDRFDHDHLSIVSILVDRSVWSFVATPSSLADRVIDPTGRIVRFEDVPEDVSNALARLV